VRLDGRTLVSHPGAAVMPDPEQKRDPGMWLRQLEMLPRRSAKFTGGGILNMLAMTSQPDKLKHGRADRGCVRTDTYHRSPVRNMLRSLCRSRKADAASLPT
jgi:hypothetical protein